MAEVRRGRRGQEWARKEQAMPQDKTPLGDAMSHRFPEQKIPEPRPAASERARIERDTSDADITQPAEKGSKPCPTSPSPKTSRR
jgi:hypothetical protein